MPPPTLNSTRVAPIGQPPVARISTVYKSGRQAKAMAALASNSAQTEKNKATKKANPEEITASIQLEKRSQLFEAARYFIFVLLFCVSAFINSDAQFFWFRNAISNVISSKNLDSVVGKDSFWDFATSTETGSFLSNFYATIDRFDTASNASMPSGGSIFLISPLRIRTLRVVPRACFPKGFDAANLTHLFGISKNCHDSFTLSQENKMDYGVGRNFSWKEDPLVDRRLIADFGELAQYPGGGFFEDIVVNTAADASAVLKNLQHSAFLDANSSYVAFEFNVFAPLSMAYLPTRIYFEFPSIGGAIKGVQLSPTLIFRYASELGHIIQGIDAILIVYFVLSTLGMFKDFWTHGFVKFFKLSNWNIFSFVSNLSLMVNLGLRFQMHREGQILNLSDSSNFTEISQFVTFERAIKAANAFTLLLVLFRVCFFYGRHVPRAKLIISSCEHALSSLIVCSCVILAIFMAFTASFYACFGSDIASYRTFGSACLSMLKALMGNSDDLVEIPNSGFPIIGPLLIGSYSTCMYFILINLFVAVLVDSFAATKLSWKILEENEISKKHAAQQKIVSDLRNTFERDLADDDVIDREELETIVGSYKDVLGFDTVDEFLNRYDENNDGEITRAELIPVLEKLDSDLAAMKNDGTVGILTGQGMLELFETFDISMNDKFSAYTETLMRMIEQRSFGGGSSAAMGMGFEGGQGIIPVQRSRDMLSQDNMVASLIGTVKAKSQFMSIKNRFSQRKLGSSSPDKSPTKISHDKHQRHSDDTDMEATLGPQHGKFEAKAPEIEDLKLRVEALQAQIALSEVRLVSVMEQLFQVGEYLRGSKTAQMAEISSMKLQFSSDMNIIASCASTGFDSINSRVVEMSDILQRVVTLLTMK